MPYRGNNFLIPLAKSFGGDVYDVKNLKFTGNSQEVMQAMEGVASVAEENSASAEEVSASAEEMAAQAAQFMINILEGKPIEQPQMLFPPKLILDDA